MATLVIETQREEPRPRMPRNGRRSSMSLPALILLFGQRHSARLHNLSCGGAMIESLAPVKMRDHIMLSCGTIETRGRVVWIRDGAFGIAFETHIPEDQILRQLYRSDALETRRSMRNSARAN